MATNNKISTGWNPEKFALTMFPFLVLVFVFFLIWLIDHTNISFYLLEAAWYLLSPLDNRLFPFIHDLRNEFAFYAYHAEDVSISLLWSELNKAGYFFTIFPILVCVYGISTSFKTPRAKTRRVITVDNLPEIMSKHCPAIIPVLYYGDLMNENIAGHESRKSPIEFVQENNLVKDGKLDIKQTEDSFIKQLGKKITSIHQLKIHEKALFCVMGYRVFCDASKYKKAQELLDELNRSCHIGTWNGQSGYPVFTCIEQHYEYLTKNYHNDITELLLTHPYPRTLLQAMHIISIGRGKLPSTNFRWLKAMDRPLWYALNGSGRKSTCIESCAIYTQRQWEDFASENGRYMSQPYMELAIKGFEKFLRDNRIII
ncbi:TPA: hypothetical protein MO340_004216 [Salmonella enterica subsp. salamae serovar 35:g,m,s,t:-]|nr:hypothetical protein [Salmonella enterica subsp. salamae serovar 35:g,m,s,t:-]HCA3549688.1 hypothetical protein [Salmonella enterica subsp. salamae serovar 35:g,m,s,t:-]